MKKQQNYTESEKQNRDTSKPKRTWKTPEIVEEDFSQTQMAQVPPPPESPGQGVS